MVNDGNKSLDLEKKQQGIIMLSVGGVLVVFDIIIFILSRDQRVRLENTHRMLNTVRNENYDLRIRKRPFRLINEH